MRLMKFRWQFFSRMAVDSHHQGKGLRFSRMPFFWSSPLLSLLLSVPLSLMGWVKTPRDFMNISDSFK